MPGRLISPGISPTCPRSMESESPGGSEGDKGEKEVRYWGVRENLPEEKRYRLNL